MRLSLCALLLLMSSRLFATATAFAGCNGTSTSSSGEFSANTSCLKGLAPISSAQVTIAGLTAFASTSMYDPAAFPTEDYAIAQATQDFTLLVTGGTGMGTYKVLAGGDFAGDPTDTETYEVELGDAIITGSHNGTFQSFGTFTYGVSAPVQKSP